jgi:GT2 family glycosyltransferase
MIMGDQDRNSDQTVVAEMPSIAVVILTLNQRDQTIRCLRELQDQCGQECDFSILVWDNGSNDQTADAVRAQFPSVLVHSSPDNLGVAGGRNAAAAFAMESLGPEFLLFLDNDMVVQPGFVRELARPFIEERGESVGQTQAKLRLGYDPERLNDGGGCDLKLWLGKSRPVGFGEVDKGQYDRSHRCVSCGGAMMVRSSIFRDLGGFDEQFNPFGPEDLDFSLRLQKAGYEAWYIPKAMAFHDVNHTFGADGYSQLYASHRASHWMRLMRRHATVFDWLGFILIGAPLIGLRVLFREGKKGNLGAIRGLITGALRRR